MAFDKSNIGKKCYINLSQEAGIDDSSLGEIIGYYNENNEEYYFVSIIPDGKVIKVYDSDLVNIIDNGSGDFDFSWEIGKTVLSNGKINNNNNFALSQEISIPAGDFIVSLTPDVGFDNNITALYIASYKNGTFDTRTLVPENTFYVVPNDVTSIRFVYGYTSANLNPPIMTQQLLDDYFKIKIVDAADWIFLDVLKTMLPEMDALRFTWEIGKTVLSSGRINNNNNFALSQEIPILGGNILINTTPDIGFDNNITALYVASYKGDTFVTRTLVPEHSVYNVPNDVTSIRFVYGYTSANLNPPIMTRQLLDAYFKIKMANFIEPINYIGDDKRPVYVAFGASTTAGAVHHYSGQDITYSDYNYPDYIGKVLNAKTFNLSVGGTGFLSRYNGDNNFMDQIYNNDSILSEAKLITLMFGYGNDHYVGPSGSQVLFPIGEYDDYYPYDEAGYHPTGDAGLVEMVNKGATLMGCLNWCIKWINEKYPYAQLIVLFGSPSVNEERAVTMTAQTESVGVAPYKLTFANPYENPSSTSINYALKQIDTELNKLKAAINIPIENLFFDGNTFSWYSMFAKDPNDDDVYALFSTKGTAENPTWNSHPNDAGYLYYARYVAGKVVSMFKH